MSITRNIFIDQGSYFSLSLTAADENGLPISITNGGYTAVGQLRRSYFTTNYVPFVTSITGPTGIINISLGATTTSQLKHGRYVYDVELIFPPNGTKVVRQIQGNAIIDLEVTK